MIITRLCLTAKYDGLAWQVVRPRSNSNGGFLSGGRLRGFGRTRPISITGACAKFYPNVEGLSGVLLNCSLRYTVTDRCCRHWRYRYPYRAFYKFKAWIYIKRLRCGWCHTTTFPMVTDNFWFESFDARSLWLAHSEAIEMNAHCNLTWQINTCSSRRWYFTPPRTCQCCHHKRYSNRWIIQAPTPQSSWCSERPRHEITCTYNSIHEFKLCRCQWEPSWRCVHTLKFATIGQATFCWSIIALYCVICSPCSPL